MPVNQVIFHIAGKAPLRINADVDEEDVPRVQRGQQVEPDDRLGEPR